MNRRIATSIPAAARGAAHRGAALSARDLEAAGRHLEAARAYMTDDCAWPAFRAYREAGAQHEGAQRLEAAGHHRLAAELLVECGQGRQAATLFNQLGLRDKAAAALASAGAYSQAIQILVELGELVEAGELVIELMGSPARIRGMPASHLLEKIATACMEARRPEIAAPVFEHLGKHHEAALAYRASQQWEDAARLFERSQQHMLAFGCHVRDGDAAVLRFLRGRIPEAIRDECLERLVTLDRGDLAKVIEEEIMPVRRTQPFSVAGPRVAIRTKTHDTSTFRPSRGVRRISILGASLKPAVLPTAAGAPASLPSCAPAAPVPLQAIPPAASLEPQELMGGRFRICEKIGTGAFGSVYSAEDTVLRRTVAIKILPGQDGGWSEDGLHEARMAAVLNHPNIVSLHDVFLAEGQVHLVMQFVSGGTCAQLFATRMQPEQLVRLFLQITEGLEHAHRAGIVHRDLKPANVLLTEDLIPRISDFGLAKEQDQAASLRLVGTPRYMSPEQRRCEAACPQSDIYSLGAMLFEAVSGRRADVLTIQGGDLEEIVRPYVELVGGLADIIICCLQPDIARRPASASELIAALRAVEIPTDQSGADVTIVRGAA